MATHPVLVTGAAGFVGGHLIDQLVAQGTPVAGWYRPGSDASARRDDVAWTAVDLLDRETVRRAIAQTDPAAVYHLAGAAHVARSWQFAVDTFRGNLLATHYMLESLREVSSTARILVSCSGTIYKPQDRPLTEGDPLVPGSPYATSKLAQEMRAVRAYREDGLPTLVARSFNHTGPGQDPSYVAPGIARQIARIEAGLQEPVLRLGNLEPKRDISDVRDVVQAYMALMTHATPGRPYNVCSGSGLAIGTLVETFVSRARVSVRIVQDPALLRPNDAPLLVGDNTRLRHETGWRPAIPFERTVDDLLTYWRQRVRS